ncbi:phosphatase PAP2 family protein [Clostridium sp. LP20]|uniref:phosphatase PAP2 family protein n=1 Tax=Clostridium sp. LP20 TaxID=3418665 RepID=UPI003EE66C42
MIVDIIIKFVKDRKAILLVLSYIISALGYGVINNIDSKSYSLATSFDSKIPLIKYFVIPYYSWYLLIAFSFIYVYIKSQDEFYDFVTCMTITMLTALLIYICFQTTVIRPEIIGDDIFSNLLRNIYKADKPVNCCPSLHVSITLVCSIWINRVSENKYLKRGVFFLGTLIILSTLFIKQHVVIDVFIAFIQVFIVKEIVYLVKERSFIKELR